MLRFIYWTCIILFLLIPVYCTGALGSSKTVDSSSQEELEKIRLELEQAKNAELEKIRLDLEQEKYAELEKMRLEQEQAKHEELKKIRLEREKTNIIQVKDNLLTVNVKGIPLNKVLMEIANQIPIKFVLSTPAEKHLVAEFSQLPIVKGLKQLLSDYNYVFINGRENPKNGGHEIREVIIMSRKKTPADNDSESFVGHAKFKWREKHLKAIPKAQLDENDVEVVKPKAQLDENGVEVVKVEAYYKGLVEELEMSHTYISQLHEHIGQLEERIEQQNKMLKKRLLTKVEEAPRTAQVPKTVQQQQ